MGTRTTQLPIALCAVLVPIIMLINWTQNLNAPERAVSNVQHTSTSEPDWPGSADWQGVTLPKKDCRPAQQEPCFDHYRMAVPTAQQPLALFIPQFIGSLRIAVNGSPLATFGSLSEPIHNIRFKPVLLTIPTGLLAADENYLQLTLTSSTATYHWLRPFYLGSVDQLQAFAKPIIWVTEDANTLAVGIYLIALLFSCAMLGYTRSTPLYAWFAAFCLFSIMRLTFFLITSPSLEGWVTVAYFFGSNLQLSTLTAMALYLCYPQHHSKLIKANIAVATVVLLLMIGMGYDPVGFAAVATVATNLVFIILSPLVLFGLFKYWSQTRHWPGAWVFALAIGSFTLTLHDVWHIIVLVETPRLQLSHVSPILMIAAFWWVVADERLRHLSALARADREQLAALKAQRSEIKRDLHDGVTSQLASLVLMARRRFPEFVPYLQESLEDLRTIMDEFSSSSDQLQDIVQDVQPKLDAVLAGYGVESSWNINVRHQTTVDNQTRRAIYLGLKECVHNALRHARPTQMWFSVTSQEQSLSLEIRDNGSGFKDQDSVLHIGHGLAGLQERLATMGGTLTLGSRNGAWVHLTMPIAGSNAR